MTEERANEIAAHKVLHGEGLFKYERMPYRVKGNIYSRISAITRDGWDILQLVDGSSRNESTIQVIVDILNKNVGGNDAIQANVGTE